MTIYFFSPSRMQATLLAGGILVASILFLLPQTASAQFESDPVQINFAASPTNIAPGGSSILSWSVSGATSCSINQGIGSVPASSGQRTVSPSTSTAYTITCSNFTETQTRTVNLYVSTAPAPTATLSASPTSVSSGNSATLTYRCTSSTSGYITPGPINIIADGVTRTVSTGALTSSKSYTLSCSGSAGTAQAYASVGVLYASISANPTSLALGDSTTITWGSSAAQSCSGTNFNTQNATSGSVSVTPSQPTTYSVTCYAAPVSGVPQDSITRSTSVSVTNSSSCPTASWDPGNAYTGGTKTLIFSERGQGATGAGGGTDDSNFHLNSCLDQCAATGYKNCEFQHTIDNRPIDDGSATRYDCYGMSGSYTKISKPSECIVVGSGGCDVEKSYSTIDIPGSCQLTAPDLTAGLISPTTAVAGTAKTFTSRISNIGDEGAGYTYTRFQRASTSSGGSVVNISAPGTSAINAGAYRDVSTAYTFPSAGTWYMRACADVTLLADEINEDNNCGAWRAISVSAPAPTVSCSVSPSNVNPGESVTYTATPANGATSPYSWTGSDGSTGYGTAATASRTFTSQGSYGMQVSASGATSPGNCPVVVVNACPQTLSGDLSVDDTRVNEGETTVLRWTSIQGVNTSCSVTGPGVSSTLTATSCLVPDGSVTTAPITTQSTYTLTCDGDVVDSVFVNVIPGFEEF